MFLNAPLFLSGILPRSWCRYTVPATMTVIQWVADFSERIKQLQQISQGAASGGAKELKVLLMEPPALHIVVCPASDAILICPHPASRRTSTCASAACLFRRLTSLLPASTWPRPTAGLWRSCAWRSMSPRPSVPRWTPAASESKVRIKQHDIRLELDLLTRMNPVGLGQWKCEGGRCFFVSASLL